MTSELPTKDPFNLVVCGVGGQGNVLASRLLGKALLKTGYGIAIGETFGMSQRGGWVMSHVRASQRHTLSPLTPRRKAHVVLGLEPMEALRILTQYGNAEVAAVVNSHPTFPIRPQLDSRQYPSNQLLVEAISRLAKNAWFVPATEIAIEVGAAVMANIVMLGAVVGAGLLQITARQFKMTLAEHFSGAQLEQNIAAFTAGMEAIQDSRIHGSGRRSGS